MRIQITIDVDDTHVVAKMTAERSGQKTIVRRKRVVNYRGDHDVPLLAIEEWHAVMKEIDFWRAQPDIWSA